MSDDSREWGREPDCDGSPKKKPKKRRPLERTLEWARKRGWPVDRTERYIPNATGRPGGTRKDLFGFADAVALDGLPGLLALQACGTDVGPHLKKLGELEHLKAWLAAGNRLWIVGWRELWVEAPNGRSKRRRWVPRVVQIVSSNMFESGYVALEGEPGG